jgi:type I restriction enzyme M protein
VRILKNGGRAAVVLPDGSLFGDGVKARIKQQLLEECNLHTIIRLPNSVFKPYATIGTNLLFFEKGSPTQEIWYYEHRVPSHQKAYSKTKPIKLEYLDPIKTWWGGPKREGRVESDLAWRVSIDDIKNREYNLDIRNPNSVEMNSLDPEVILRNYKEALAARNGKIESLKSLLLRSLE